MGTKHRVIGLFVALAVVTATTALSVDAQAQEDDPEDYGDTIHVVQPKPVLQQGRLNVTPQIGMTINDPLYQGIQVGGLAKFHVSERFFLGGFGQWHGLIGGETQTYHTVSSETNATIDAPYLNWAAGGEIGFSPIFGKFSLFNRNIIFYNVSLSAGAGFAESSSLGAGMPQSGPVGSFGIGAQFFFNEWMGLDFEVRDIVYQGNVQGQGDVLSHSVTLGVGISLMLPRSFEYDEAETL